MATEAAEPVPESCAQDAPASVANASLPPLIEVRDLRKHYRIWKSPGHRLQSALWHGAASVCGGGRTSPGRWLEGRARGCYRDFAALKGVSFSLQPGDAVGIVGRNGSGKSTLLQIIAGVLEPTAGQCTVRGQVAALLELAAGFNPEFTGRENVYLNTALHGMSAEETDARFGEITAFAGIGDFIDQPVKTYSTGMGLRLAFAVKIILDAPVFIVDEALSVGDIFFQQKCFEALRKRLAERTRLIVSHDIHAIQNLVERLLVLEAGRIVYDGPTREGVAFYLKMMQDESFAPRSVETEGGDADEQRPEALPEGSLDENLPWQEVAQDKRSGRGEAFFRRLAVTGADGESAAVIAPGEPLVFHAEVEITRAPIDLLFGYQVRDRTAVNVVGDTCLPHLGNQPLTVDEPGRYVLRMEIDWPYITPGEYTLTLGIGEGHHPFQHVIQCWAQDFHRLSAISPHYDIHAQVAHPLKTFSLHRHA